MIRVKPYEYHPNEVKCDECYSTIQYDNDDVTQGNLISGDYYDIIPLYIRCPRCGHNIRVGGRKEINLRGIERDREIQAYNDALDRYW